MRHVLVVGGMGPTVLDTSGLGIRISLFQHADLIRPETPKLASRLYVFNYENQEESLSLAHWLHSHDPLDAVISFTESGVEIAALICEQLGILGNPGIAVRLSRDKNAMRQLIAQRSMPLVRFKRCTSAEQAREFFHQVGSSVILKPVNGSGSEGVSYAGNVAAIGAAWVRASKYSDAVLAEEFLVGPEYSVEALSLDGHHQCVAITEKLTTDAPYFIETGHQMPADLSPQAKASIEAVVVDLLDAIEHRLGPSHTELRLTPAGPRVIETHTRPGGDFLPVLVERSYGVDLVRKTLTHLSGKTLLLDSAALPQRYSAIRFFILSNVVITGVSGLDSVTKLPGVEQVVCDAVVGDEIGPLTSSDSRQGFIVVTGDTLREAQDRVEAAMAHVVFETRARSVT